MDLSELEAANPPTVEGEAVEEGGEWTDPEEALLEDFKKANSLLESTKVLLDYVSDVKLVKALTKRERDIMSKMSENIRQHLVEADANWSEDEYEI